MKTQRPRRLSTFFPCALVVAGLASLVSAAQAQTSGTLIPTTEFYNYSTAPWVITSGTGTYPSGGGVATFGPFTMTGFANTNSNQLITLDVSPTLSQIVVNSPYSIAIYPQSNNSSNAIIAANTGLTINTTTARDISSASQLFSLHGGFSIQTPISGGGTAGLTKTGSGNLGLSGVNTYTGGTHVNGGLVLIGGTGYGDAALGATGAGNGLFFNGGGMVFSASSGTTSARDIFLDTGGATLYGRYYTVLSGVISGTGALTVGGTINAANQPGGNDSGITLQGVNTYTGATIIRNGGDLVLSGAGSLLTSSTYDFAGSITLDNSGTNVANRLSDTVPITLRGATFSSSGNFNAASSETVGAVTAASGINCFLVNIGSDYTGALGQGNILTMASLARQNNATFVFSGTGLGGTPGVGVANIYSAAAPTLVGGGGGAGSTNISILPYAIGTARTSTGSSADLYGSSFVTYGATGFRPLATSEYATGFGNATDNVRLTGVTAIPAAGVTANAVLVAPSAASTASAPVLSGGTINVTSGAFMYSPTSDVTGYSTANLNFGSAEGVFTNTSRLFFNGTISGSSGLTINSTAATNAVFISTATLGGANTYTGNTTINAGGIAFSGTTGGGTAGAFGPSGTIILSAGGNYASLDPNNAATINNPISVIGGGQNYVAPTSNNYTVTFNGPINLAGNLNLYGAEAAPASALIFNGQITGTGSLTDFASTYAVFNGNNTYSGGTIIRGDIFYAGTNTAFGTGTISFVGGGAPSSATPVGGLAGVGTAARTIANPLLIDGNTASFAGAAPLTLTGPVSLNGASTINVTNTALTTFTGVISDGGVSKTGTGAVAFNSPTGNTFTGGFVNGAPAPSNPGGNSSAIYANNASGSAFGAGIVSIGAESAAVYSTLAGSFSTSGAASIAGRLSPGNGTGLTPATAGIGSIGRETFTTTLTLSSGTTSSLYMEVGAGNTSDQIVVGGTFTLAGTVYIASLNGYTIQNGDTFTLITAGTLTPGTVTFNTSNANLAAGVSLVETFTGTQLVVSAIPEPGTYTLFAVGSVLAAASFARRRCMRG